MGATLVRARWRWLGVWVLVACGVAVGKEAAIASKDPFLLRDPSLSRTEIAFTFAGDIWVAKRDGGGLRRLTTSGHEAKPTFSPDGAHIAFIGEYDGVRSVYVIPSSGGMPTRLTFHPADLGRIGEIGWTGEMIGWTPDGKRVLFSSSRGAFASGVAQLFTVPIEGGFATPVPLVRAAQGSFSPDSSHMAYVPNIQWQHEGKQYCGGQTTAIWIACLADPRTPARIPRAVSTDFDPMWIGDTIYFLSDRNGPVTLFSYALKSHQVKQVVRNSGFDIKSAFASSDGIVYEQFGSLHLWSIKSGRDRFLNIRTTTALPEARPHAESASDLLQLQP